MNERNPRRNHIVENGNDFLNKLVATDRWALGIKPMARTGQSIYHIRGVPVLSHDIPHHGFCKSVDLNLREKRVTSLCLR